VPNRIQLPLRRERLAERSRRDQLEEAALARLESPSERLALALELSELTRDLAEAASASWLGSDSRLSDKLRFYVTPLESAARVTR
jgi:hypothetical protein